MSLQHMYPHAQLYFEAWVEVNMWITCPSSSKQKEVSNKKFLGKNLLLCTLFCDLL